MMLCKYVILIQYRYCPGTHCSHLHFLTLYSLCCVFVWDKQL